MICILSIITNKKKIWPKTFWPKTFWPKLFGRNRVSCNRFLEVLLPRFELEAGVVGDLVTVDVDAEAPEPVVELPDGSF
jgi:hypothetical protein